MTKRCYKCGIMIDEGHGAYTYTILQRTNAGMNTDGKYIFYDAILYLHIQCDVELFGGCKGGIVQHEGMNSSG